MVKKKELAPKIEKRNFQKDNIVKKTLEDLDNTEISFENEETTDSFFKGIVDKLFDSENVETKTEYLSVKENFVGTKLSFLAKYGNIPYLAEFIKTFERKRISLNRRGRKEIIMALEKREEEIRKRRDDSLKNMLGI